MDKKSGFLTLGIPACICLLLALGIFINESASQERYLTLLGCIAAVDSDAAAEAFRLDVQAEDAGHFSVLGEETLKKAGYKTTGPKILNGRYYTSKGAGLLLSAFVLSVAWAVISAYGFCRMRREILAGREAYERANEEAGTLGNVCRQLEARMEEFMGNICHQFKTPLTGIQLCLDLIRTKDTDHVFEEELNQGSLQTDRLSALTTLLIKEGQLQTNRVRFHYQPTVLGDLLLDAAEAAAPFAAERKITLDFCPWDGENLISCDGIWLREAFQALLQNCIDHGNEGGQICIRQGKKAACYTVDLCTGSKPLDQDKASRLFERWYTDSSSKGHFGIGMHLVKTVLERHFGAIEIRSEEKYPLVFHIKLPILYGKEIYTVT